MILVDTSIWIDHLRHGDAFLIVLLERVEVLIHPFVIGEIAMGSLSQRPIVLAALSDLPHCEVAPHDEVIALIDRETLFGRGLGYIDAHLLASTMLYTGCTLWTKDRRLHLAATGLGIAAPRD